MKTYKLIPVIFIIFYFFNGSHAQPTIPIDSIKVKNIYLPKHPKKILRKYTWTQYGIYDTKKDSLEIIYNSDLRTTYNLFRYKYNHVNSDGTFKCVERYKVKNGFLILKMCKLLRKKRKTWGTVKLIRCNNQYYIYDSPIDGKRHIFVAVH